MGGRGDGGDIKVNYGTAKPEIDSSPPSKPFSIVTLLHSLINHCVTLYMGEGIGRVGYIRSVHNDYVEVERIGKTSYFRISSIYQIDIPTASKVDK